jgi:hypothetical protein
MRMQQFASCLLKKDCEKLHYGIKGGGGRGRGAMVEEGEKKGYTSILHPLLVIIFCVFFLKQQTHCHAATIVTGGYL